MSKREVVFEETLSDEWSQDLGVVEVPLNDRPLRLVGIVVSVIAMIIAGRLLYLMLGNGAFYSARAEANKFRFERMAAPRGLITDRNGEVLADNRPVFSAQLDLRAFVRGKDMQEPTLNIAQNILGVSRDALWNEVNERASRQSGEPIVLAQDLTQQQVIALKTANLETVHVVNSYKRFYTNGPADGSFLGYVGLPTTDDLDNDGTLSGGDVVGKTGLEVYYDKELRGTPGLSAKLQDAQGRVLGDEKRTEPEMGKALQLSIDEGLQEYFYKRFSQGLASLGRTSGVGLAIDPRSGEMLAYLNFPSYDPNIFSQAGHNDERRALLTESTRPLFNRAIGGLYNPGSTIKPLHGLAALTENVVDPGRSVFSPGYMDVPNPYDPDHPSRFVDWRSQGNVNLYDAIAQSSNVYFYIVGGGSPPRDPRLGVEWNSNFGIKGLGISRLKDWWKKFRLDQPTGIDLPGEAKGFLPDPDWKKQKTGRNWLLGDTYNVSIGQGDLSVTPLALLNYISTIANGGRMFAPSIAKEHDKGVVTADFTSLAENIKEVQKGMRRTVTSPLGTARTMNDLPFQVAGKTGSAQVQNNTQENAFFVGYAPYDDPQIVILVLVENSKEGSLNAVPIAKDVLNWYYENRITKSATSSKQ